MKFRFRSASFKNRLLPAVGFAVVLGAFASEPTGKSDAAKNPVRERENRARANPERTTKAHDAQTTTEPLAKGTWRVLIEPRFMRPEVSQPISGSKAAVLAAGWAAPESGEVRYFRKGEFANLRVSSWDAFMAQAQAASAEELSRLVPEYIRDKKQVIECAILHSDRQTTSSAVLAPNFLKRFQEVFGPKVLVAVPNRFTIYVFPALASRYADYGGRVIADYYATVYPVSREIFELSATGFKATGAFQ